MTRFLSPELVPFPLFGTAHLATLALAAVVGFLMVRGGRRSKARRSRLRWAMVAGFLIGESLSNGWSASVGRWQLDSDLPLHLCGVMVWVSVYGLVSRARWACTLMYFFGVAGASQALLTPSAEHGIAHIAYLATMLSHGLLVIAGLWVVLVEEYRPGIRDLVVAFVILNIYALALYPVNLLLGSNYMYLVSKPESQSLFDVFPSWPWYLLLTEFVAFALFVLMYLPFRRGRSTRIRRGARGA